MSSHVTAEINDDFLDPAERRGRQHMGLSTFFHAPALKRRGIADGLDQADRATKGFPHGGSEALGLLRPVGTDGVPGVGRVGGGGSRLVYGVVHCGSREGRLLDFGGSEEKTYCGNEVSAGA